MKKAKLRKILLSTALYAALAVLCLFSIRMNAQAAEIIDSGTCGENLTWTLDSDGLLTISGTGPMTYYNEVEGPWYPWPNDSVQNIVIEEGVTSIGSCAFYNCSSPVSIIIPDSVTSIGDSAFRGCSSLVSITFPDSVTSISDYAFYECTGLTSLIIPDSVTVIGNAAFRACVGLTSVSFGNGTTIIGKQAFFSCDKLTSVSLGKRVAVIGEDAFASCYSLSSVKIPDSVTEIDVNAFSNCGALSSLTIGSGVTQIGNFAFNGCYSLETVCYTGTQEQWALITFGAGNAVLKNATLHTSYVPTVIEKQPVANYAIAGSSVKFTVAASGKNITYQWQYRTSADGEWKNASSSGNKTSVLTVPVTTARNDYQYRCQITDSFGVKVYTETVKLTVFGVKTQPVNQNIPTGKTVKFTVKATGEGLKYQWQYRTSSKGSWKNETATGSKTATLSVAVTAARNGYQYRCVITDKYGNVLSSNAATLTVVTLKVTAQPAGANLPAGKTAKFTVKATGIGLTYQWQYRTSSKGSWKNESATGNKTAILSVAVTAAQNGYQYRCKITDKYGRIVYSNAATLKVVTLKVTTQPANKYLPAGKTAKFTVKVSGTGLKYQWQFRKNAKGTWKNVSGTGNKKATLSVAATAAKNGYQYRCKITDQYGNVIYSKAATLKIVTLKITTQPSSVTLAKGKTATFKVVAKGTGLKYQWQFRKNAKGAWKKATNKGNKTATLKVPVTAARNGYQYRCVITDKYGNVINTKAATLKVK